jgi:hypothetical protein
MYVRTRNSAYSDYISANTRCVAKNVHTVLCEIWCFHTGDDDLNAVLDSVAV